MKINRFNVDVKTIKFVLLGVFISALFIAFLIIVNAIEINTFGHNSDFNLLFSGLVAIATAIYAIFTYYLVNETKKYAQLTSELVTETKKLREIQNKPNIALYLQVNRYAPGAFIETIIENDGVGPAKHIKLIPDIDFIYSHSFNDKLSGLGTFKDGIQYLSPKGKKTLFSTYMLEDTANRFNTKLNIIAKYEDENGKPYESSFILNFSEFNNYATIGKLPLLEIADRLSDIGDKIESLEKTINEPKIKHVKDSSQAIKIDKN